jgi:hypothetical protein
MDKVHPKGWKTDLFPRQPPIFMNVNRIIPLEFLGLFKGRMRYNEQELVTASSYKHIPPIEQAAGYWSKKP